ncbi:MAG: glutathione S-transferase family protein [Alphaproteobacteria bacterium]|nr:glutathione S-transferase family protein [Alphaproteobacteria bacterium]
MPDSFTPDTLELFSAQVCPYAHRSRLALAEKGLEFTLSEIDLADKSQRFLDISPYGKVPVLLHNGRTVYESAIVNEYLNDSFPTPALLPDDPYQRAQARIWIDYFDNRFLDTYYDAMMNKDRAKDAENREKIETGFRFIENEGMAKLSGDGPYWLGATLSLVDLAYYPFLERLPAWTHHRGIDIPDDCTRLRKWCDVMRARPSVQEIANPPEYYIDRYKKYAGVEDAA